MTIFIINSCKFLNLLILVCCKSEEDRLTIMLQIKCCDDASLSKVCFTLISLAHQNITVPRTNIPTVVPYDADSLVGISSPGDGPFSDHLP